MIVRLCCCSICAVLSFDLTRTNNKKQTTNLTGLHSEANQMFPKSVIITLHMVIYHSSEVDNV